MNNIIQSDRRKDEQTVEYLNSIMDKIYSKNHYGFVRNYDVKLQKQGVDLIYTNKDNTYYVDEKAAIKYYNTTLNTFSFEIGSNVAKGWFREDNDYIITTHYILIYPKSNSPDLSDIYESVGVGDFKSVKETLDNVKVGKWGKKYSFINKDVKLVQSVQIMPEQPINIVINKEILKSLSNKHEIVKI